MVNFDKVTVTKSCHILLVNVTDMLSKSPFFNCTKTLLNDVSFNLNKVGKCTCAVVTARPY